MDINTAAPVITRDEILIHAPSRPSGTSRPMSPRGPHGSPTLTAPRPTARLRPDRCSAGRPRAWTSPPLSRRLTPRTGSCGCPATLVMRT